MDWIVSELLALILLGVWLRLGAGQVFLEQIRDGWRECVKYD